MQNESPEKSASFLSKLTFFWFNKLIFKGYRKSLIQDHIWPVKKSSQSNQLLRRFELNFKKQKILSKNLELDCSSEKSNGQLNGQSNGQLNGQSNGQLNGQSNGQLNGQSNVSLFERESRSNMLMLVLVTLKTFWKPFLIAGLIKLVSSCLTFASPILLKYIISFMSFGSFGVNTEPLWHGYFYAILLFISPTIESILNSQFDFQIYVLSMDIKSCFTSLIYKKIYTLSSTSRNRFSTGEIVNLMSIDTQR